MEKKEITPTEHELFASYQQGFVNGEKSGKEKILVNLLNIIPMGRYGYTENVLSKKDIMDFIKFCDEVLFKQQVQNGKV